MFTCTIQVLHFQLSFQITIYDARRRNHRNRDGVHVVGRRQSRVHDREDRFVDRLPGNVRHGRHTRLQGDLDAEDPARLQVDDLHLPVRFTRRSCGEFWPLVNYNFPILKIDSKKQIMVKVLWGV